MDLVPLKNALQKHNLLHTIKNDITKVIQEIPHFDELKLDLELTCYICNLIENVAIGKTKLDKKTIAIEIITTLFGLSDDETHLLDNQIQYLYDNKKISKLSTLKYVGKSVFAWIKKKVL